MKAVSIYEKLARSAGWDIDTDGDGVRSANAAQWAENWKGACEIMAEHYAQTAPC